MNPIVHHPTIFRPWGFELTGFGLAVVAAFAIAQVVSEREYQRRGYDPKPIADLIIGAMVGGLLGAKLYYVVVLNHYDSLWTRGGFVFWGGLIGGIASVVAVARWQKIPLMRVFDLGGPAIAAAYTVGRTGCWAVGDDYGRPWSGPLAVAFPEGLPPSKAGTLSSEFGITSLTGVDPNTVVAVHPTQLYEVAMGLGMFFVLWRLRDHKHAEGWLFGVYCVLAGAERFVVEFFRAKDDRFAGPLTYAQVIALAFIAIGIAWMYARRDVGGTKRGIYATAGSG